jgi:hypothetical protein
MSGDEIVRKATVNATRAITIDTAPAMLWPWMCRWVPASGLLHLRPAGQSRAARILPEYQDPKVGDWMLRSKKVNETTTFKVKALEPDRWLLWEGPGCTLSWKLCADRG